jgi:hypothetical protein
MNADLKLNRFMGTVSLYSVVTLVFFTTYIVFQPPATVIVRALGPRKFLSFIVVAWGAVMIGMGFADSFHTLAALRVVLGILEAGFFPSCVYLLSTWYTRFDIGKRYSVFYILGSLASACAGILAYGLMQIKGDPRPNKSSGINRWRWIFIIEGALTCFLGIAAYWMLVDFPDKAHMSWKFLTQREAKFIIDRVDKDRGDAKPEPWNLKKFLRGGADIKIWGFAMVSVLPLLPQIHQLTCSDLLQHHNRHIRSCILPPYYPDREYGLLSWRIAMSCCPAIRARSDRYVRDRLGRRQVPRSRTHHRLQHDLVYHRCINHGFPQECGCPVLWSLPHNRGSEQQCTGSHVVPGQQHSWAVEACILLSDAGRYGRCRRYRWRFDLQVCWNSGVSAVTYTNNFVDSKTSPATVQVCTHVLLAACSHSLLSH